jgi:periplasmic protein TonB
MFDTSLVRAHTVAASRRYTLFAVSIALHSAVAVAAISLTLTSVDFPKAAPDQVEIYRPIGPPPPLGTLEGGGPKKIAPPVERKPEPVKTPEVVTQPQAIPEETPLPEPTTDVPSTTDSGDTTDTDTEGSGTGSGSGPFGSPMGVPGGIGTEPGGTGILPGTGPLNPGGEVRSATVLRKVEPNYPPFMLKAGPKSGTVVVRCVIDEKGKIRDPQIIRTTHAGFNNSVLDAVRQWTFVPGTLRGQPVDTWFELTVSFKVR